MSAIAAEYEEALDCTIGLDIGLVDAPDIAVAEPRKVQPAFPFDSLTGERTLVEPLQPFIGFRAKDFRESLADDLLDLCAETLGLLAIDIEVAEIATDKRDACRDRVQNC